MSEIKTQLSELEQLAHRLSDAGSRLYEIVQKADRVDLETFDPETFWMLSAWLDIELSAARSEMATDTLAGDFDRARYKLQTAISATAAELDKERRAWITAMVSQFDRI